MNLPTNADFAILRSLSIRENAFFALIKHDDNIFSTGVLVDIPKQDGHDGGWQLFGEIKYKSERAAVIAYNKMTKSVPVKLF
jgi:hypothetical protein